MPRQLPRFSRFEHHFMLFRVSIIRHLLFFLKKLLFCADKLHFFIVYLQWKPKE